MKQLDLTLYLCTDRQWLGGRAIGEDVERAIEGGVTLVQLREKDVSTRDFLSVALEVQQVCNRHSVPLLINDRIDIALAVDAQGVHIGQSDMPCTVARRIIGPDKILGVSANNIEHARNAEADGADYIGIGAAFPTQTKAGVTRALSASQIAEIAASVRIPACAIGGIGLSNGDALCGLGLKGISVISAILSKPDIRQAASDMRALAERIKV